jgi:hypothetical protein
VSRISSLMMPHKNDCRLERDLRSTKPGRDWKASSKRCSASSAQSLLLFFIRTAVCDRVTLAAEAFKTPRAVGRERLLGRTCP